MSLWFTVSQTLVGNIGSSPIKTLDHPHRKFFWFFSFKKRTRKPYSKLTYPLISAPKGRNASFIILNATMPLGIPMIVIQQAMPAKR